MKKLFILSMFILLLCGCSSTDDIYSSIYIASIGLEYKNSEYIGYFLLPSSQDVGNSKNDSSEGNIEVATIKNKTVEGVFEDFSNSSSLHINLKHISTFVFHESFLTDENINEVISYVKDHKGIDLNFYIFTTKDKIEDIFKTKNPSGEPIIMSLLIEPVYSEYNYINAKPLHFLNFCREFLNDNVADIPNVKLKSVWGEDDSIYVDSIYKY